MENIIHLTDAKFDFFMKLKEDVAKKMGELYDVMQVAQCGTGSFSDLEDTVAEYHAHSAHLNTLEWIINNIS